MPIWIGAAISGLAGAGASLYGASKQTSAEQAAIQAQQQLFGVAQNELQPFITGGQNALTAYEKALPGLTAPFTAATLPSTPGYQFTLNQGLKDTQNSYAAMGLGSSGAAEKGAASYTTGLAQSTYNQQLQNYLAQNLQTANLLYQPVNTGVQAGGALAGAAVNTGQGISNSLTGIGNAQAGGAVGTANALTGGVNTALQYSLLQQLLSRNSFNNATTAGGSFAGNG